MAEQVVRGVIDRFEGDYAVVVLDDEQLLDWPRAYLPPDVRPGQAVALQLIPVTPASATAGVATAAIAARAAEGWPARITTDEQSGEPLLRTEDGQTLRWPLPLEVSAQAETEYRLTLAEDTEDTAARRQRVANLLEDIFGEQA